MKERPGSWSVLICTMAAALVVIRWVGARFYYLVTPLILLIKFLGAQYRREIDAVGDWIVERMKRIWTFLRRRTTYAR